MKTSSLPPICSFWHGPVSWLERLSIASFLAQGHDFTLFSYERPENLPPGCAWRDAAAIAARDTMVFYKNGRSPAVFADHFRLLLMKAGAGIWADCDMICVRPLTGLGPYVFGYEIAPGDGRHGGQINNAVLRLPPDAPLLDALLGIFEGDPARIDPVWMPGYRRVEIALRRFFGEKIGLSHMQFGATGPFPLTYFARKLDLDRHALPRTVFYPLAYRDAPGLLETGSSLAPLIQEDTLAIHLWRMALTGRSRQPVPPPPAPGSALAGLAGTLGVETGR